LNWLVLLPDYTLPATVGLMLAGTCFSTTLTAPSDLNPLWIFDPWHAGDGRYRAGMPLELLD
jgi:hypothetical protein